jgi:hypothetical protein
MKLLDVEWALPVNLLLVHCDCTLLFRWPADISVVRCPLCGRKELWHSVDPKPEKGPWSLRVMENKVALCPLPRSPQGCLLSRHS